MIASWARGIFTFSRICRRVAPNDAGRLDRVRLDVADAALDQAGDDREGVEDAGDHARDDGDRHQVDERDQVDELRQRLEDVVDRSQDPRERAALGGPDPEADADGDRRARWRRAPAMRCPWPSSHCADDPDQREHQEGGDRRAPAADDERDQRDPDQHHGPRRLDEEVPERHEPVLDDVVADPARDLEQERVRVLDVVEHRLDPRQQPVARRRARVDGADAEQRGRRRPSRRSRRPSRSTPVRRRRRSSSVRWRCAGFVRSATASVTRSSAIAMTTMTMPARMRERRVGVQAARDDVAEALAADQARRSRPSRARRGSSGSRRAAASGARAAAAP